MITETEEELNKVIDDIIEAHFTKDVSCKMTAECIKSVVRKHDRQALVRLYTKWKHDFIEISKSMNDNALAKMKASFENAIKAVCELCYIVNPQHATSHCKHCIEIDGYRKAIKDTTLYLKE